MTVAHGQLAPRPYAKAPQPCAQRRARVTVAHGHVAPRPRPYAQHRAPMALAAHEHAFACAPLSSAPSPLRVTSQSREHRRARVAVAHGQIAPRPDAQHRALMTLAAHEHAVIARAPLSSAPSPLRASSQSREHEWNAGCVEIELTSQEMASGVETRRPGVLPAPPDCLHRLGSYFALCALPFASFIHVDAGFQKERNCLKVMQKERNCLKPLTLLATLLCQSEYSARHYHGRNEIKRKREKTYFVPKSWRSSLRLRLAWKRRL